MKRIAIAVMLAAMLLLMMPTAVAAAGVIVEDKTEEDSKWIGNTWQVEMFPGEIKSTTIKLYNSSSVSLGVEVTVLPDSWDNGNLAFELDKTNFIMSGGSRTDVILTVEADGSVTPGVYQVELEIKSEMPVTGGGGGGAPPDSTPPTMSNISVSNIGRTAADISWRTNEASTSQVEYWTNPGVLSPLDEAYVLEHHIGLTGLTPVTAYCYKTMSRDRAGNLAVSNEFTFTTLREVEPELKPIPLEPELVAIFSVGSLSVSPKEVCAGESVDIGVLVSNSGDATGSYEVVLLVDGMVENTKLITLDANEVREVTFVVLRGIGSYSVSIGELEGSFEVREVAVSIVETLTIALLSVLGFVVLLAVAGYVIWRRRRISNDRQA